ncbi:TonB-dependent receptor plug domain-containing protein [Kordiimonas sp.]|uniref:TonB-dependent receptor plug domain-containing protein n=1 Tax=Kordiimonas sp. TaxID=1970157 RepID=UPI003A950D19
MLLTSSTLVLATDDIASQGTDISIAGVSTIEAALQAVSEELSINILATSVDIAGLTVGVEQLPRAPEAALRSLLAGSGLHLVNVNERTFAIVKGVASRSVQEQQDALFSPSTALKMRGLEEIIVTGTRNGVRPALDAMAPVDSFASTTLMAQPAEELIDILATLLPGFTAPRRPLSDGQIFVRPASLRGLSPDHMLVFVNGKRRHRTAFLGGRGEQAPELSNISQLGVARVEVLRDGASAQYGSDAIAGVINVILDEKEGFRAFGQYGEYYGGDGDLYRFGARNGWRLGGEGFFTATAEYFEQAMTSRTRQRPDATEFKHRHPDIEVPEPVQNWGQPERKGFLLGFNSGWSIFSDSQLYSFGSYGESDGWSDLNWRNPDTVSAYDHSTAFPEFDLRHIYPAGFTPKLGQDDTDFALTVGAKGSIWQGALEWDISTGFGESRIKYQLADSINASLGPDSPTRFYLGRLGQKEFNSNIDLTYRMEKLLGDPVSVALGAERRAETYSIGAGDPASYSVGPGAGDGLPAGADGFPGYSDSQAGSFNQTSYAAYIDVEVPLVSRWKIGFAARHEKYSGFGSALDGKFSSRLELTNRLALRATLSTGFSAPTPGQLFSERTSKSLDVEDLTTITSGRFSPDGAVARVISARPGVALEPLGAEKARNINIGLTYRNQAGLAFSLDFYRVSVKDRFGLSESYELTAQEQSVLAALGVPDASGISNVNFLQNDFDTVTRGVDLSVGYSMPFAGGLLGLNLAYNLNETKVTGGRLFSDAVERHIIENGAPGSNLIAGFEYQSGRFEATLRGRIIGQWADQSQDNGEGEIQTFGAESFLDASVKYHVSDHLLLHVGAVNMLNQYPDQATFQRNRGLIYSRNTPYDTDGGFYYLRAEVSF